MLTAFSSILVLSIFLSPFLLWSQNYKKLALLNGVILFLFVISWREAIRFIGETDGVNLIESIWGMLFGISLSFFVGSYFLFFKRKFNFSNKQFLVVLLIAVCAATAPLFLFNTSTNLISTVDASVKVFIFTYTLVLALYVFKTNDRSSRTN